MATVNVSFGNSPAPVPAGVSAGGKFRVSLVQGQVVSFLNDEMDTVTSSTFTNVPPGDYIAVAVAIDSNSNPWSTPLVSAQFNVPVSVAMANVPTAPINVTVS